MHHSTPAPCSPIVGPIMKRSYVEHFYLWNAGFLLQDDLRVACNPGAELGWKSECLIKGVRMQGLRATEHSRHRFYCRADYVIVRILHECI